MQTCKTGAGTGIRVSVCVSIRGRSHVAPRHVTSRHVTPCRRSSKVAAGEGWACGTSSLLGDAASGAAIAVGRPQMGYL